MNTQQIDEIYLRLNVIDRKAAWTSERARDKMEPMLKDIRDRMETYLNGEFPSWKEDQELRDLFNRG